MKEVVGVCIKGFLLKHDMSSREVSMLLYQIYNFSRGCNTDTRRDIQYQKNKFSWSNEKRKEIEIDASKLVITVVLLSIDKIKIV